MGLLTLGIRLSLRYDKLHLLNGLSDLHHFIESGLSVCSENLFFNKKTPAHNYAGVLA